ncbi:MAG: AMP-binding protein [Methylohalobius sp. ZOD2]
MDHALAPHPPSCVLERVSRARLHEYAARIAGTLPADTGVLNLCEDRFHFTATLLATAARRLPCLLPPNRTSAALERLAADYDPLVAVCDRPTSGLLPAVDATDLPESPPAKITEFSTESLNLIAFTSGSTGNPQPWPKDWQMLREGARRALQALDLMERRWAVMATTPAQHMFGLETSVVWPLCSELALTDHRPFYPEDIRQAIAATSLPVLLVSTPLHLKACLASSGKWPNLAAIISSTAPLDPTLARELENVTERPLWELYGSTETQSFAWRRPARDVLWRLYPGAALQRDSDETRLTASWLPSPWVLGDNLEVHPDGRFRVLGRRGDLLKIGGKRASLAELNWHLNRIDGVEDGCFFVTDQDRVGALVVSRLSKTEILAALRRQLDELFLPRPLHTVDRIPRNATGKIVKAELDNLLGRLRSQARTDNARKPG